MARPTALGKCSAAASARRLAVLAAVLKNFCLARASLMACKSDFCVFSGGGSLGMCTQTCEGDIDCPELGQKCVRLEDAPQKVCVPE